MNFNPKANQPTTQLLWNSERVQASAAILRRKSIPFMGSTLKKKKKKEKKFTVFHSGKLFILVIAHNREFSDDEFDYTNRDRLLKFPFFF